MLNSLWLFLKTENAKILPVIFEIKVEVKVTQKSHMVITEALHYLSKTMEIAFYTNYLMQ